MMKGLPVTVLSPIAQESAAKSVPAMRKIRK
jgi:hypothetical protein